MGLIDRRSLLLLPHPDGAAIAERVFDREQMLDSLDHLAALEKGGAKTIFGHDLDFWKTVPRAPAPLF